MFFPQRWVSCVCWNLAGEFGPVLKAIDKMIALLQDQEQEDLETKQTCEKDRMSDTRDALVASRDIDDWCNQRFALPSITLQCGPLALGP